MKILFLTYIPSPYRMDFFNEFGKKCDLTVVFEKKSANHRNDNWKNYEFKNFRGVILKEKTSDNIPGVGIINYLKDKSYDEIIIHNVSTPTGMLAIQYMKNHKMDYWIESDGGFAKSGKGIKEFVKRHFIKGAKGYFSPCSSGDKYLVTYGAAQNKIYRYPFTSLYPKDIIYQLYDRETKQQLRNELAMRERFIIITVGRFSYLGGYGKGYDVLMDTAKEMDKDIGIYIIGDEPTQEFLDKKDKDKLNNVHFVGFKKKQDLLKYYLAADVFVLMTVSDVWGLVINEAMGQGLPVITTNMCGAGLELVENDVNGYVIDVGDISMLRSCIENIIYNNDVCKKMSMESIKKIKKYTYFDMVKCHMEVLEGRGL